MGEAEFVERVGLRQPFLAKPFTPDDLVLTTADTLARSQELLAEVQARQAVTRGLPVERSPEVSSDLVAAAHRLRAARTGGSQISKRSGQLDHGKRQVRS